MNVDTTDNTVKLDALVRQDGEILIVEEGGSENEPERWEFVCQIVKYKSREPTKTWGMNMHLDCLKVWILHPTLSSSEQNSNLVLFKFTSSRSSSSVPARFKHIHPNKTPKRAHV